MKKLSILIVEDDIILSKSIALYLNEKEYVITGTATSGEKALEQMESNPADIVIMDIHLKGKLDGVDTARLISKQYAIPIIYVTESEDENIFKRAKTTFPKNYLAKPFHMRQLSIAIDLAITDGEASASESNALLRSIHNKFVFIHYNRDNGYRKILVEDISLIESSGPYSLIYVTGMSTPFNVSISSNHVYNKLNSPLLKKVHKSFYVNLEKVDAIENKTLLISGKRIPIGLSQFKEVIKYFNILKR